MCIYIYIYTHIHVLVINGEQMGSALQAATLPYPMVRATKGVP